MKGFYKPGETATQPAVTPRSRQVTVENKDFFNDHGREKERRLLFTL